MTIYAKQFSLYFTKNIYTFVLYLVSLHPPHNTFLLKDHCGHGPKHYIHIQQEEGQSMTQHRSSSAAEHGTLQKSWSPAGNGQDGHADHLHR